ncbi:MAG: glutathione S-transferase family protein [Sphingobium sp.]
MLDDMVRGHPAEPFPLPHRRTLYQVAGSRGLRALWTIEEMGLDCDLVMLPAMPRAKARKYLGLNPLGTVPAFVDDGVVMTESVGIAHYLATRYGPTPLAVSLEEVDYPRFLDFLHHADATLTFPQTVYIRYRLGEPERGLGEAGELYADWFAARLVKLRERIADRTYVCAERFTIADIAVAYPLFLARLIGLGDRLGPELDAYLDRMTARPGFVRAREREQATPVTADFS